MLYPFQSDFYVAHTKLTDDKLTPIGSMKPQINNSNDSMSFAFIPPPFPFPEAWPHIFQTQQTKWLSPGFTLAPPPTPLYASYNESSAHRAAHPSAPFPSYPPQSFADPAVAFPPPHVEHAHEAETPTSKNESGESDNESSASEDGEYIYGYVLSDEWRGRFRSSLQARQRQQQQQRSQRQREQQQQKNEQAASSKTPTKQQSNTTQRKKTRKQQFFPSASDQRAMDLQREFAAAKQREAAARRPIAPREDREDAPPSSVDALQSVRRLETQLNLRFDAFCDAFLPVVWPHDAVHK